MVRGALLGGVKLGRTNDEGDAYQCEARMIVTLAAMRRLPLPSGKMH